MKDAERSVLEYQAKYHNKLRRICEPLKDHLGVSTFIHYSIDINGIYAGLTNNQAYFEYDIQHGLYKANPFLVHPLFIHSGCLLVPHVPGIEAFNQKESFNQKYQVCNPFLLLQRRGTMCEGFFFSTYKPIQDVNFYLNFIEHFKRFIRYFKKETRPFFERMKAEKFSLASLKEDFFYHRPSFYSHLGDDTDIQKFLKKISPLSCRERECFELFREGYSAEATAKNLGISKRTVEHYFESIKDKLGCKSKWELLRI